MDCGVKSREVELGVLVTLKNTELVKTISTIANTNHVGHFEIIFYSITYFLLAVSFILFCCIMASSKTLGVCVVLLVVSIPIAMHVVLAFFKDFRVAKECGTFSLSLEHGSVEPAKMLFGNVGLVTCLPGFTLSGGVKCDADAHFVPVGSLTVCSPRSCGVPPEVSGASRSAKRCSSREMPHTLRRRIHRRWILLSS